MLKLTRLDHRIVAINPDHIAWVEATPDTTLCLLGDRKVIVRETVDEVVERFIEARAKVGCSPIGIPAMPSTGSMSTRPSHRPSASGRPSGRPIGFSSPPPQIIEIDDGDDNEKGGH